MSAVVSPDHSAPPESRVAPYYPAATRHLAPMLNLHAVPGADLLSKIGLQMVAPMLDTATADEILRKYSTPTLSETDGFDFASVLPGDARDRNAASVADEYFPASRRNEVPVFACEGSSKMNEEDCFFTVSRGVIESTGPLDDEPVPQSHNLALAPGGGAAAVNKKYGRSLNKAPVISFSSAGNFGISLVMEEICGEPSTDLYDSKKFNNRAPVISLKRPAGDWDTSGFVNVSSEELALPLNGLF
jgi:hypothetical protein